MLSGLLVAGLLAACGGGKDKAEDPGTTLSGVVSKGLLKKAVVKAYGVSNGVPTQTVIAQAVTNDSGEYSLSLGGYTGAVQIEVSVTSETRAKDEALGTDVALPADFKLRSNTSVTTTSGTQAAHVTPFTELAHKLAESSGGITAENIAKANSVVFSLVGVDPVGTKPLDYSAAAPTGATEAEKKYALLNAAISKIAAGQGGITPDATTQQCLTAAGTNPGERIKCAVQQISSAVTIGSTPNALPQVNDRLAGLKDALVAVSSDSANKTGATVSSDDSLVAKLSGIEDSVKTGTAVSIKPVDSAALSDIAKVQALVKGLRSNAKALETDTLDSGVADKLEQFANVLRDDAAAASGAVRNLADLLGLANDLWEQRGVTGAPGSVPLYPWFPDAGGCSLDSSNFPADQSLAFTGWYAPSGTSVTPGPAAGAKWVGCNVRSFLAPNGEIFQRVFFFNFGASSDGKVPYAALTRRLGPLGTNVESCTLASSNSRCRLNLSSPAKGEVSVSVVQTSPRSAKFSFVGDLPPSVKPLTSAPFYSLLADRYAVDVRLSANENASGTASITLDAGTLGVVPVGGSAVSTTLDISPGGASAAVLPTDTTNLTQLQAARVSFSGKVSNAKGLLAGSFSIEQPEFKTVTGATAPELANARVVFAGKIAVADANGVVDAAKPLLDGKIELTKPDASKDLGRASISGTLALPNRPLLLSLGVVITQTSDTAATIKVEYKQGDVALVIEGKEDSADNSGSTEIRDANGVVITDKRGVNEAVITVNGRAAGKIIKDKGRIEYVDGTFETIG